MGILTEQNILGDPSLGTVTRPGSETTAAYYSFATVRRAGETETLVNPQFIAPSPYAFDKAFGIVTHTGPTIAAGIDAEPILFPQTPEQYGPPIYTPLANSQQTNLGAAAEVIAGNSEATELPITQSSATQMDSAWNKQVAQSGPEASGGPVAGYTSQNMYSINKASSAPPPESTPLPTSSIGDLAGTRPASGYGGPDGSESTSDPGAGMRAAGRGGGHIAPRVQITYPMAALYGDTPVAPGSGTAQNTGDDLAGTRPAASPSQMPPGRI